MVVFYVALAVVSSFFSGRFGWGGEAVGGGGGGVGGGGGG